LWAAVEARHRGRGGVSTVAQSSGDSRTTIYAGLAELDHPTLTTRGCAQATGAHPGRVDGRNLPVKIRRCCGIWMPWLNPTSRGDTDGSVGWTCKSTPKTDEELRAQGHAVSQRTVCDLMAQMGYSLQSTRKTREGGNHLTARTNFSILLIKSRSIRLLAIR